MQITKFSMQIHANYLSKKKLENDMVGGGLEKRKWLKTTDLL